MKALIYKPTKSAMQSGRDNENKWIIEFDQDTTARRFINPLMGWTGAVDMNQQVRMYFSKKGEAIAYVTKHNIEHEIIEPQKRKITPKSYTDNFCK